MTMGPREKSTELKREAEFMRKRIALIQHLTQHILSSACRIKHADLKAIGYTFAINELAADPAEAHRLIAKKCVGVAFGNADAIRRGRGTARTQSRRSLNRKRVFAKALRVDPPESERRVSEAVARRFSRYGFRSNVVLWGYIPDLYSASLGLIIEIDGTSHHGRDEYDARRDAAFARMGIQTVRIPYTQVFNDMDGVMATISGAIEARLARARKASAAAAEARRKRKGES